MDEVKTIGDVASAVTGQISNLPLLFMVFCAVAGLIVFIMGCFKLKKCSDSKGTQVKMSECILYILGGTMLLTISNVVGLGKQIMGLQEIEAKKILELNEKKKSSKDDGFKY